MLFFDVETYSETDIRAGTYRYAETSEVLIAVWSIDDGPVGCWDLTQRATPPAELDAAMRDPSMTIVAHNAIFDRRNVAALWPEAADPGRWECTMCQAYSHGFPGGLADLCHILDVPQDQQKLASGKKLIQRFCKPAPSNHRASRYDWRSHPDEWDAFIDYAMADIPAMREVRKRLPMWNWRADDIEHYRLDQRINDRGFFVDVDLVGAGIAATDFERENKLARFAEITHGAPDTPKKRAAFLDLLNIRFGLGVPNVQGATLRPLLDDDRVDPEARELIELALSLNKTSVAKYQALDRAMSPDRRMRGTLQYAGAARTRRFAGRIFQPQNLPRGDKSLGDVEHHIGLLKSGLYRELGDEVDMMTVGSTALRGVVIAPPGKKLVVSDLSNIEGRANAWIANEEWKLEAFAANDRKEGPDLYKVTASEITGRPPSEIDSDARTIFGKLPELSMGYAAGVMGLQKFCRAYGVRMADHWETISDAVAPSFIKQAEANYQKWGKEKNPHVDVDEWIASETIKLAWRARNPAIVNNWYALENAFRAARAAPNEVVKVGKRLSFRYVQKAQKPYMLCRLPSGKVLSYFRPGVDVDNNLTHWGVDQDTRRWVKQVTYGGRLCENICQSISRDVLMESMPHAETAGFEIILTVHDELVTEAPDRPEFSADLLSEIMADPPAWADGFPLASEGFEAKRYRK